MRKLATIRKIDEILPHSNADRLEIAKIGGWRCIVEKGKFSKDELVLYFEIDSLIPKVEAFDHLSKYCSIKERNGKQYYLIKTTKLRGELSQGLVMKLGLFYTLESMLKNTDIEGKDLTDELGILLYEPELPNMKEAKNVFPYFISKTDQERIQNLEDIPDDIYEITEKVDGTSCTIYYNNGETGVCSRNIELKPDMAGLYQEFYDRRIGKLEEYCIENKRNLALQGEIVGTTIQGNPYRFNEKHFYLFDIFDIDKQEYLLPKERYEIREYINCQHVPVVQKCGEFKGVEEEIKHADGLSLLNPTVQREGLVFKSTTQNFSFKVISNKYLLNQR